MEKGCFNYAKGCEDCQRNGPIQHVPAVPLNPIVKPRPFRGWAVDFVGKVVPSSSNEHTFIIVATDYFIKWVEASAVKSISSSVVITFIKQQIIHRFGIPETITTDKGTSFISKEIQDFSDAYGIKFVQSSPYFPRANGQAESTNKVLINIIKKMAEKNPRDWHERLSKALWADRTSKKTSIDTTPFALTYGHDAVLPVEISVQSLRIERQPYMNDAAYVEFMMQELEQLSPIRAKALNHLMVGKQAVARAYNKRVRGMTFEEGELVCRAILPLGTHVSGLGKWSPTWEGPFVVHKILGKGAYLLQDRDGTPHQHPINGQWLKKFLPSLWETTGIDLSDD
ncbi:uncharacterized protein K02A2.6-like [Prunus avium]|uniref:Uncharacterized protein K02A2.6-like n=1 Tax=Prunus avium TaxID=42229 RepID=A0A6P5T022_PRUAV|nr:uncharacterized protein K02A2.6-like [Prunus avium]